MLWKTDEKVLLEKRGEDRGKLMLTGRSETKTSYGGREVSVHVDRHTVLWNANSCEAELLVLKMGTSLTMGFMCDQTNALGAGREGFSWVLAIPSSPGPQEAWGRAVLADGLSSPENSFILSPVYTCSPSSTTLLGKAYPLSSLSRARSASSGAFISESSAFSDP